MAAANRAEPVDLDREGRAASSHRRQPFGAEPIADPARTTRPHRRARAARRCRAGTRPSPERGQAVEDLGRERPGDDVAEDDDPVRPASRGVGEHGVERVEVPVDVGERGGRHRRGERTRTAFGGASTSNRACGWQSSWRLRSSPWRARRRRAARPSQSPSSTRASTGRSGARSRLERRRRFRRHARHRRARDRRRDRRRRRPAAAAGSCRCGSPTSRARRRRDWSPPGSAGRRARRARDQPELGTGDRRPLDRPGGAGDRGGGRRGLGGHAAAMNDGSRDPNLNPWASRSPDAVRVGCGRRRRAAALVDRIAGIWVDIGARARRPRARRRAWRARPRSSSPPIPS